mgnify:CR=1 FL=1
MLEYTLEDELFTVTVPTYRNDITMDADLVEEVARFMVMITSNYFTGHEYDRWCLNTKTV